MKKKIAALVIILFLASTSVSFARGNSQGYRGGYNHGYHSGGRPGYGSHGGAHHNDGLGIAVGVVGGLLLGSALMYSAPPPQTVVYGSQYTTYQPPTVVQQPRICVEDQTVSGEWQTSRYDGRRIWVLFPYPVTLRVQVPCY